MGRNGAQRYLFQAIDAVKRKDDATAETLFLSALQHYPSRSDGRKTTLIHLGAIYRRSARFDEAIAALEQGLPFPAAFTELKGIYRFFAKACHKEKDSSGERANYAKLYSLAMIEASDEFPMW